MNWIYRIMKIRPYCLMLAGCLLIQAGIGKSASVTAEPAFVTPCHAQYESADEKGTLADLNMKLRAHLQSGDMKSSARDAAKVIEQLTINNAGDSDAQTTAFYLLGIYHLLSNNLSESIRNLENCALLKEQRKELDAQYAKTIYNIGAVYNRIGDFLSQEQYSEKSLALEKKLYGESNPLLIKTYSSIAIANIGLQEYDQALENSNKALALAVNNPDSTEISDLASVYNNLGVLYMWKADYSKAKLYLEKSESLHIRNKAEIDENYFNFLNSLAIVYGNLGMTEKSNEYYKKGIDIAATSNSSSAYNFINSYAIDLLKKGRKQEGEALLYNALRRAKAESGEDLAVVLFSNAFLCRIPQ